MGMKMERGHQFCCCCCCYSRWGLFLLAVAGFISTTGWVGTNRVWRVDKKRVKASVRASVRRAWMFGVHDTRARTRMDVEEGERYEIVIFSLFFFKFSLRSSRGAVNGHLGQGKAQGGGEGRFKGGNLYCTRRNERSKRWHAGRREQGAGGRGEGMGGGGGGGQGRPAVTPPVSSHPWDRSSPIPGLKRGVSRTPRRPPDGHG